jgi:hypothetical protein
MVTSVQTNTALLPPTVGYGGAGRSADARSTTAPAATDTIDVDSAYLASVGTARGSVSEATSAVDLALATGRDGAQLLSQARDLARQAAGATDDATRGALNDQFQSVLQSYANLVGGAAQDGDGLLAGGAISVAVDPEAAPVQITGQDARLKDSAGGDDILRLTTASNLSSQAAAAQAASDADSSLSRLDAVMSRMSSAAQKLSAHDNFLSTVQGVSGVNSGLDADAARLLALQVRQSLSGQSGAIANAAPQAILGLFRD